MCSGPKGVQQRFNSLPMRRGTKRATAPETAAVLLLMLSACAAGVQAGSEAAAWRRPGCHKTGHTRPIKIEGCVEFSVTTNACRGFCESWSLPSIVLGYKRHPVTSLGQCCNIMESEDVPVKVACLDGERRLTFKSAQSCACYHCKKD